MALAIEPRDRYLNDELIAGGGMAGVWRAYDRRTGCAVAVKRLHPHLAADPQAVERFRREIAVATSMDHPAIAAVHDSGEDSRGLFMVMELIDGETLRERIERQGPLPWTEAQRIAIAVAGALAHAHERRVLHRDIKPGNILLENGTGRVVLVDFGIAASGDFVDRLTQDGGAVGTIDYLAPERAFGSPGTKATDIYALGAVFYEMVTGVKPYRGATALEVALAHQAGMLRPPGDVVAIPPSVEAVIVRAMARAPADRFASADDFVAALCDAAATTQECASPTVAQRALRWWHRQRRVIIPEPAYGALAFLATYFMATPVF